VEQERIELLGELSERERSLLRLVLKPMTSKEIAIELGLSDQYVDQLFKGITRKLGVSRRIDAARLLSEHEAGQTPLQQLEVQSGGLAERRISAPIGLPDVEMSGGVDSGEEGVSGRSYGILREEQAAYTARSSSWERLLGWLGSPFPTARRKQNSLEWTARLTWMVVISFLAICLPALAAYVIRWIGLVLSR